MARVTHEDGGLDLGLSRGGNGDRGVRETLVGVATTAVCVIEDLTTLRVADQDEEGVGALLVEGVDLAGSCCDTLDGRVGVADAAAGRLATACGVVDRLGRGAGVRANDQVDDDTSSTVSWRNGGFTRAEDVNLGALSGRERRREEEKCYGEERHF